jgi:hypothetical protein
VEIVRVMNYPFQEMVTVKYVLNIQEEGIQHLALQTHVAQIKYCSLMEDVQHAQITQEDKISILVVQMSVLVNKSSLNKVPV